MPSRLRPWHKRCYMQPIHCGSNCFDGSSMDAWDKGVGNVALTDGSVSAFNNATLQTALANSGDKLHTDTGYGGWGTPAGYNRLQFY